MQHIIPHLWFDKEAKEAAAFYVSLFSGGPATSEITSSYVIKDTPSGDCDAIAFSLWGFSFISISAGPYFKLNPSISFMVKLDPSQDPEAASRIDTMWSKLSEGGKVLMPLQQYPFSERYGWVQDRYGVSWQLILTKPEGEKRPLIIPSLLFTGDKVGKAEEATDFYLSVFPDSKRGTLMRYPAGMEPDKEGTVSFTDYQLRGQWFAAMDSARNHDFTFSEAISLIVPCDTQEEIDRYWNALSAVPESEQCGWLKDKYGVSWQISPRNMEDMMGDPDPEKVKRVTQAFMPMKKLDMAAIQRAYEGK